MAFSNDKTTGAVLSAPDTDPADTDRRPADDRPAAHQTGPFPAEAKAAPGRGGEPAARPGPPAPRSRAGRALAGVI
ncbi:hypothetical protein, partial [Staphylococcus aureus]